MSMIALAMAALALQMAPAPEPAPQDDETTVESVIVSPPVKVEEKKAIETFVDSIAAETGNGRIARWDRRICPGVTGVRAEYGQFVVDRVNAAALKVGLQPDVAGCKINVLVVFTADSDGFVKTAMKKQPNAFSRYDLDQTAGRKAMNQFIESDAPVRWWLITHRVTAEGKTYNQGEDIQVYDSGRIRSTTRDDFDRAFVVVDAKRVGKVQFSALADYIAFVSLAQIDPEAAPPTGKSILSLFADRDAGKETVADMTDWDLAYLTGVYGARRDVHTADRQKNDIVDSMGKTLKEDAQGPAKPPK